MKQPEVSVGIMRSASVDYELHGAYVRSEVGDDTIFTPTAPDSYFTLHGVTIGIGFHWQRKEDQHFAGALVLRRMAEGNIQVINRLSVEEYLCSVISSEMSATAPLAFLKASAVISRSWLLAQMKRRKERTLAETQVAERNANMELHRESCVAGNSFSDLHLVGKQPMYELIKWYDQQDHEGFDVCSDDHCQRYQGITRASTPIVREAVHQTAGQVLWDGEELCDARFGKCCGGATEKFSTCWQDMDKSYLASVRDVSVVNLAQHAAWSDLSDESTARSWIDSSPPAFCNVEGQRILSLILNNYDQETREFFRWEVRYTRAELSELVCRRSGYDLGEIVHLTPLRRGPSGRISLLRIEGTRSGLTVGKELEIRRLLSESHLYSSAFYVEETPDGTFVLHGAGWGHGVGMCQIGAAVMAEQGYDYTDILNHYYPGSSLETLY